ncbi:NTP transferase domain-containing protein [Sapientia aquatica]|uniref:MobA-like NTP transferase domain-containing protein n=1 Tax=Sapientia aquatica TaxID=1549640 RepID=A0A4R5W422_9BURK|nr:NTP transferase domain-containing protein [Sapientia aquatica]TDK67450.1 hypothetical protein E2I14_06775 [Sapientia aquatica]
MTTLIIQAGGKGSRLEHYCWNKPKCLVPVDGKPLLFHLLDCFASKHDTQSTIAVIAEYKADVLQRYLSVFPGSAPVSIVAPVGTGTVSGIAQSLELVADNEPFWIVWSDLLFHEHLKMPESDQPVIYLSRNFPCRWSVEVDEAGKQNLVEKKSDTAGVMGLFWFPNKSHLKNLPDSGEFVRWISENANQFSTAYCDDAVELGTLNALQNHWDDEAGTRFFNKITYRGDKVIKQAVVPEYAPMIDLELAWYKEVGALGFKHIPTLFESKPMTMSRIDGTHPYQFRWGTKGRRQVLEGIMDSLTELHALGKAPVDNAALRSVYLEKTQQRIAKVGRLLPDLQKHRSIKVNGVWVPNILHEKEQHRLTDAFEMTCCDAFTVIHGDPTFSNTLIDDKGKPWFFDPRGRFAEPGIFGDPAYDWAKVYYSVVGNYDNFNRRQFILSLDAQSADIEIRDAGWSHLREVIAERFNSKISTIQVLHSFIWLGLSGWVDDDYDSILAAYFNGLYYLHSALEA